MWGACTGAVLPKAEACNGLDDDCDGVTDDGVGDTWFPDLDNDSFGAGSTSVVACMQPAGYAQGDADCNDNDAAIHPGAGEVCGAAGVDEDCDGMINEGCACTLGSTIACCGGRGVQTCTDVGAGPVNGACSVVAAAETCNGVDDDCDGLVDEGVCVVVPDSGTAITDGGNVTPDAGPVCVPATETCNGVDDDCDGLVDENLKIACLGDADNDLYATSAAVTQLCPNSARPAAGNCPLNYVASAFSKGLDCSPTDATKYRVESARNDADNDLACTGPTTQDCIGAASLPGRRVPASCAATDDCNDQNAAASTTAVLLPDADNDGRCANQLVTLCIGNTAPAGYKFAFDCLSQNDCDDASATTWRMANVRLDGDKDGFCIGAQTSQCIGTNPPSGWRLPGTCNAVDDCRDTNPLATSACVLPAAYKTSSAVKTCAFVPATQSFTVSVTNICPLGFVLGSYAANKTAGNGFCTATSELTLSMTCNGLDGATCNILGACLAQ